MKPTEPEFLKLYKQCIKEGPPKCCHTCDYFDGDGICTEYKMQPPDEFINEIDKCQKWTETIPF